MPTALFVILPIPSHYMASFGFARLWQQRGYTIAFTGLPQLRKLVEEQGFDFVGLVNTPTYVIHSLKIFIGLWLQTLTDARVTRLRYREWWSSVLAMRQVVEDYQPELIFLDEHLNYYALYVADYPVKVVVLNTKLSTRRQANIPPPNSRHSPRHSLVSKAVCWWQWEGHLLRRFWQMFSQRIVFCGKDETYFEQRLARRTGRLWDHWFATDNAFYNRLTDAPTVILAPQLLEYGWYKQQPNEFFLNPALDRDESCYLTNEYRALKTSLLRRKETGKIKVIYAAFGTLVDDAPVLMIFLLKLMKAVQHRSDWFLVLATGKPVNGLATLPNVACLSFVPQLDMLAWADVMITHGGLTTIKECLLATVPMLAYPLDNDTDQYGNTIRLKINNLGFRGDMANDQVADIQQKLANALRCTLPTFSPDDELPADLLAALSIPILDLAKSHKPIV